MQRLPHFHGLVAGSVLLALASVADAQALFLARRAIGRIEQMSQSSPTTGAAYDVATVIVEVTADKVFETVKRLLAQNTQLRVTRSDDARRSVEFTDGTQIGGIQVNPLNDNLSQMMVSTAHPGVATSTTSTIVSRILVMCRELNVVCEQGQS